MRTFTITRSSPRGVGELPQPASNLALLTKHLVFPLQLTQPRPLLARQHVATLATVGLVLTQPVRQRLRRATQLLGKLLRRPRTAAQQPHRLLTELRRIRRSRPRHPSAPLSG